MYTTCCYNVIFPEPSISFLATFSSDVWHYDLVTLTLTLGSRNRKINQQKIKKNYQMKKLASKLYIPDKLVEEDRPKDKEFIMSMRKSLWIE